MYPVIILAGKAGSGKDTVAAMLAEAGGICIAQADPLKRFAHDVFAFSADQLWGPSECRNALDLRPDVDPEFYDRVWERGKNNAGTWLQDVGLPHATNALHDWLTQEVAHARRDGLTPRHVLQTLGTEFGRKCRPDVWVSYAQRMAKRLLGENLTYGRIGGAYLREPGAAGRTQFVVITDGRFPNEILATKEAGGLAVKIDGPGAKGLSGAAGGHASETEQDGIPLHWYDAVVWNDKARGFEPLRRQVAYLARAVVCRPPAMVVPDEDVAL